MNKDAAFPTAIAIIALVLILAGFYWTGVFTLAVSVILFHDMFQVVHYEEEDYDDEQFIDTEERAATGERGDDADAQRGSPIGRVCGCPGHDEERPGDRSVEGVSRRTDLGSTAFRDE